MTEQQRRSLYFSVTGRVATLNPFEYFIFCKGMDVEREACAKVCEEDLRDVYIQQNKTVQEEMLLFAAIADCANAIRARGQE